MSNGNNTGISTIAERYALSMIELGENLDLLDNFDADLAKVKAAFDSNDELTKFITHPTIPLNEKKDIIDNIFKNYVSEYVLNLIKLLLDRNRIFIFPFVVNHYHGLLNKKRNIVVAEVITAIEIDEETRNKITDRIEKLFEKKIALESKIDSDIIAGMIIKVGDRIIDGSIKSRLENMKKQLI